MEQEFNKVMKELTYNDVLCHMNKWWWGESIDIIRKDGLGAICVKFDKQYPTTAFFCDLTVFELTRRQGIGTELMNHAHAVARKFGKLYAQLDVDKENQWLIDWYKDWGFDVLCTGEHEITMIKYL